MTVVGAADYNRKDNRIEIPIIVSFEEKQYQTLDWGMGGFRIGDYDGELKPEDEFTVDGVGMVGGDVFGVRIDCRVARRLGQQLGAGFIALSSDAYDLLEALMMRRKKYLEKLKKRSGGQS
jgi:hypothetical protein